MAERVARQTAPSRRTEQQRTVSPAPSRVAAPPRAAIGHLQRTLGNRGVHRLLRAGAIQAKLTVGAPDDEYELEADRVADEVMRMPEPRSNVVQRAPPPIQRVCPECDDELQRHAAVAMRPAPVQIRCKCAECDEKDDSRAGDLEEHVQRKAQIEEDKGEEEEEERVVQAKSTGAEPPRPSADLESYLASTRGGGQPLPSATRAYFEPRFGHDFSRVRIHSDGRAARSARDIEAHAFATGPDIYFASGAYSPGTPSGDRLLAHELVHVVQQGHAVSSASVPTDAHRSALEGGGGCLGQTRDRSNAIRRFGLIGPPVDLKRLARNRPIELRGHRHFEPDFLMETLIQDYGENGEEVPVTIKFGTLASGLANVRWHPDTETYEIRPVLLPMKHPAFKVNEAQDSLVLGIRVLKADSSIVGEMGFLPGLPPDRLAHISGQVFVLLRAENMHKAILGEDYDRGELDVVAYSNGFENGALSVQLGGILTVAGDQRITAAFALEDGAHAFKGGLRVRARGLDEKEIEIERGATGALSGEGGGLTVSNEWNFNGIVKASLTASYANGILDVRGEASLKTARASGEATLLVTDEDLAWAAATEHLPAPLDPGAAARAKAPADSKALAMTGWGTLDLTILKNKDGSDLLTGSAAFVVDPEGYVTVKGTVSTKPTKFTLIEAKASDWKEHFTTGEWSAWLSVPWAPGGLKISANGGLSSRYTLGPVTLYDIEAEGMYSTNPAIPNELTLSARLNGSAEAQGRVDITGEVAARFGTRFKYVGVNVVSAALHLFGIGTLKGYVDVAPTIGIKQASGAPAAGGGAPEYFIKGTLNIGGELDVELGGSIRFEVVAASWEKTVTFVKRPIAGFDITFELDHTIGQDASPNVKIRTGDFKRQLFVKAVLGERKVKETDELEGGFAEEGKTLGGVTPTETPIAEAPPPDRETLRDECPMSGEFHVLILELGAPGDPVSLIMESDPELLITRIEEAKTALSRGVAALDRDERRELDQRLRDLDRIKKAAQGVINAATRLGVDPKQKGRTRIPGFDELGDLISAYGDRYDATDLKATAPGTEPAPGTREAPFELVWRKPPSADYPTLYFGGRIDQPKTQSALKGLYTRGNNDETGTPVKKYTPHAGGTLPGGEEIGVTTAFRVYNGRIIGPLSDATTPGGRKLLRILERYGFDSDTDGMQGDHVQEIQFGGADLVENLWPLEKEINLAAGPKFQGASVKYPKTGREVRLAELKKRVKLYYFKITGFDY